MRTPDYYQGGADMVPLVELGLNRALDGDLLFTPTDIPLPPQRPARAVLYMLTGHGDDPGEGDQLRWVGAVRFSEKECATVGTSVVLEEHRHDMGYTYLPHVHLAGLCRSIRLRHGRLSGLTGLERQQTAQGLGRYAAMLLQDTFMAWGQAAPFDPLHEDMRSGDPAIRMWERVRRTGYPLFYNGLLNRAANLAIEKAHGPHAVSRPLTRTKWYSGAYHDPETPAKIRRMVPSQDAA